MSIGSYGYYDVPANGSVYANGGLAILLKTVPMSQNGTAVTGYAYLSEASGAPSAKIGLYTNADPRVKLDETDWFPVAGGYAWYSQPFLSGYSMASGVSYAIAVVCISGGMSGAYDNIAVGSYYYDYYAGQSTLPASIPVSAAAAVWSNLAGGQYLTYSYGGTGWSVGGMNGADNADIGSINGASLSNIDEVNGA